MLSNKLQAIVTAAVSTELIEAKHDHGDRYASAHEGFGVLAEELHEATMELRDLDRLIRERLIVNIHENDDQEVIDTLADAEVIARNLACEAIQVATVARKFAETMAKEGKCGAD